MYLWTKLKANHVGIRVNRLESILIGVKQSTGYVQFSFCI
jgi:hypothetical protein